MSKEELEIISRRFEDKLAQLMPKEEFLPFVRCVVEEARLMVENAPTVDAVEVVRCKDCIHKPRGTRNKHDMEFPDDICPCQCEDYWYSWMPYDDWFCANGERREDETN